MKTLKLLLAVLVVMVFVGGANQVSAASQMVKWYFPGKSINFLSDPPLVEDLPGGPEMGNVSNGICRGNGETMFYIIDGVPYDYYGDPIDPSYGIGCDVIVPLAKMRSIVFTSGGELHYSVFDPEYNAHVPPYVWTMNKNIFLFEDSPFGDYTDFSWGDIAVTKNPCHWFYLYVETPKTIKRWTLGYHNKLPTISDEKTIYSIGTLEYKQSEFEVSPNGRKLAVTMGSKIFYPDTVFVIDLDTDGLYVGESDYPSPYFYGTPYICSGLEFSGDSSKLYATFHYPGNNTPEGGSHSTDKDGIYYMNLSDTSPQWIRISNSQDYAYSQLELARNGLIYAASKTNVLSGFNTSHVFTSTINGINVPTGYQYLWGWPKPVYDVQKQLPKQIDGYNYDKLMFNWELPFQVILSCIREPLMCKYEILPNPITTKKGKGLSWECVNPMASSYNVYFGMNFNDVNNASTSYDPCSVYKGRVVNNNYFAENLAFQQTYYWRVDAVNDVDPNNIWKGDVWEFTTDDCILPLSNMTTWFAFDENSGIEANDRAGAIHSQGTLTNGASFISSGKVDGGLQLDGVNDFVDVYDDPELNFGTGDFSIDAWVKTSVGSGTHVIVDKRSGPMLTHTGYVFFLLNGNLALQLGNGGPTNLNYFSSLFVADGNWVHVAVTVDRDDPNGLKFYVGGVSQTRNPTGAQGTLDNSGNLLIGSDRYFSSHSFNGSIDEVDLFNRALDVNEILAIFEAGSGGMYKQPKPAESKCNKADLNDDGTVNFEDFAVFANCWLVDCK
jgi:hypothetical protein